MGDTQNEKNLPGPVAMFMALTEVVFESRVNEAPLPPETEEILTNMAEQEPPLGPTGAFLQEVADSSNPVPTVPTGLPRWLNEILEHLVRELKIQAEGEAEDDETTAAQIAQLFQTLAQVAFASRTGESAVPEDAAEALEDMAKELPPAGSAARFLQAVIRDETVPPVPPDLPTWLEKILKSLVRRLERLEAGDTPEKMAGQLVELFKNLAADALAARRGEKTLPEKAAEILQQLADQPPPVGPAADILQAAARGEAIPPLPEGQPLPVLAILKNLAREAKK
jgi:hypothetical protein